MANLEQIVSQKAENDTRWKAQQQSERENTVALQDAGIMQITSSPEAYARYLDMQGDNPAYSVGNIALVMVALPQATVFGTRDRWRALNRSVMGEEMNNGVKIFARGPMGRGYVLADAYDVSQTQGRDLKRPVLKEGSKGMETALTTVLNYAVAPVVIDKELPVPAYYDPGSIELAINPDFPDHSGTPQGSGMSPILANIYMSELDQFIARKMLEFQRKESYRKPSKEYEKIHRKYLYWMKRYKELRDMGRLDESEQALQTMKSCRKIMFQTNGHDPFDPDFKSIQYNRYADDFLVGVIGSGQEAVSLKEQIANFLKDHLKLTLSMEKTKVTHSSQRVRYLGYDIFVSRSKDTKRSKNGTLRRAWYGTVNLRMPHEKWQSKLQEYKAFIITHDQHGKEQWRAMPRRSLVNREDIDILRKFNSEISGLYQYYRLALNVSTLNKFLYIMEYSMLKTFGMKYRAKVSKIKERYVRNGHFGVDYMTKAGPKRCEFYHDGFQMNEQAAPVYADILPEYRKRQWSNSLANRLKAGTCEICGLKTDSILIHHVKKLKKLKGKDIYELKMLEIRRKTLALCQNCYFDCHNC